MQTVGGTQHACAHPDHHVHATCDHASLMASICMPGPSHTAPLDALTQPPPCSSSDHTQSAKIPGVAPLVLQSPSLSLEQQNLYLNDLTHRPSLKSGLRLNCSVHAWIACLPACMQRELRLPLLLLHISCTPGIEP